MARKRRIRTIQEKFSVEGFQELQIKLRDLHPSENKFMKMQINDVLGDAATEVRDQMRASAMIARWPVSLIKTIFSYYELNAMYTRRRNRPSALAGVSKRQSMIEWRAGAHPKSPRAKNPPGKIISESLATMMEYGTSGTTLEYGTSHIQARPAIRPALRMVRARVRALFVTRLREVLKKFSK
jgi:hypothetical protein